MRMAATVQLLRYSPQSKPSHCSDVPDYNNPRLSKPSSVSFRSLFSFDPSISLLSRKVPFTLAFSAGGNGTGSGRFVRGNGDGSGDGGYDDSGSESSLGPLGLFLNRWRSRVAADPQFPFKVLMEELVGVSACVLGDMASRPNFGLNELDFVFSTLVVGSILNYTLMYLLAPTMFSSSSNLPAPRVGTLLYKGSVFSAVGFAAGLVGTAISNGLIKMRKKMDPNFETPNKPPPTLLNALTWAFHMGVSSNIRYQTLNGIEFVLAKGLQPLAFKSSVVALRCFNNILGGMSFVVLARLTGSQSVSGDKPASVLIESPPAAADRDKFVEATQGLHSKRHSKVPKIVRKKQ